MDSKNKKTKKENIHKGHRARVKNLYKTAGIESLPNHVVLELLLFFGIPYKDTNEISHELINKFGSFENVFEADIESLKSVKHMTDNASILIKLISDIAKKNKTGSTQEKEKINTPKKLKDFLLKKYMTETVEKVYVLFFGENDCLEGFEPISIGNREMSEINIGKIVKMANVRNIKKVSVVHNHPDNSPISTNDIISTKKIAYHLKSVDIDLGESYVVTNGNVIGILKMIKEKP